MFEEPHWSKNRRLNLEEIERIIQDCFWIIFEKMQSKKENKRMLSDLMCIVMDQPIASTFYDAMYLGMLIGGD